MVTAPAGLEWRCLGAGNGLTWTSPAWLQPGVGKTMLAVGLSIAACQAGYSVCFTSLHDVVRNLSEAEGPGRFAKNRRPT